MALDGDLEVVGAPRVEVAPPGHCVLELARLEDLEVRWDGLAVPVRRVVDAQVDRDGGAFKIDVAEGQALRLREEGVCTYLLAADGRSLWYAPEAGRPAGWQRMLIGQVLPLAAVLQGLEVLHASCVAVGARTLAIVAAPNSGKSSLAASLLLAGARFVTDDVLAVKNGGEAVTAYPGPGVLKLRESEVERLGASRLATLSPQVERFSDGWRLAVETAIRPRRLTDLVVLARTEAVDGPPIRPLDGLVPFLLGSTFNLIVGSPERRRVHLDVCASVAATVRCSEVAIHPGLDASRLAELLLDHLAEDPPS
jgi:hypothetical protein